MFIFGFLRTSPPLLKNFGSRWRKNGGQALFAHRPTENSSDVYLKKDLLERS